MAAMLRRPLIALGAAEVVSSLGTLMAVVAVPALVSGRIAVRLGARRTMLVCDAGGRDRGVPVVDT
jgi:hypothetical protein